MTVLYHRFSPWLAVAFPKSEEGLDNVEDTFFVDGYAVRCGTHHPSLGNNPGFRSIHTSVPVFSAQLRIVSTAEAGPQGELFATNSDNAVCGLAYRQHGLQALSITVCVLLPHRYLPRSRSNEGSVAMTDQPGRAPAGHGAAVTWSQYLTWTILPSIRPVESR